MVKTRLISEPSVEAVTELYRCLLNDTIALARTSKLKHVWKLPSCARLRMSRNWSG